MFLKKNVGKKGKIRLVTSTTEKKAVTKSCDRCSLFPLRQARWCWRQRLWGCCLVHIVRMDARPERAVSDNRDDRYGPIRPSPCVCLLWQKEMGEALGDGMVARRMCSSVAFPDRCAHPHKQADSPLPVNRPGPRRPSRLLPSPPEEERRPLKVLAPPQKKEGRKEGRKEGKKRDSPLIAYVFFLFFFLFCFLFLCRGTA
jgi:hypothetical protein